MRVFILSLFIFLVTFCLGNGGKTEYRHVTLEGLGVVRGEKYWNGEFYEFYGIPYATVPQGRDRYKAPLPPKPWEKKLKAKAAMTLCPQVYNDQEEESIYGVEECLVAHVLAPKVGTENNPVPVVVFIHSGAFAGGSAFMAKSHKVVQQDVVTVFLNYRLGAIGFACLGTEAIPGNAALKDLVAGLKWVNKYIKSFGGDPNNVTLAGFSVGATLVEILSLLKDTEGLFHRLILDSGSALMPFAINRDPINTAWNIAKAAGFENTEKLEDLDELEEFYLEPQLLTLLSKSRNFFLQNSTFGFAPCIENPKLPGALLTESPYDILKRGDYPKVSVMAGFGNMEGISRTSQFENWTSKMNEDLSNFLPVDLVFSDVKAKADFMEEVKKRYFNGKEVSIETLQGYIDYFSDSMFKYGMMRSAKLRAMDRPIYLYEFTYVGKLNTQHQYMDRIFGASHRDATSYVLDFYEWTRNFTDMDQRDIMVAMWTDYVKYENPTAYESILIKTNWKKYSNEDPNYLEIGYELVNKKDLFADSYNFWDKAYQNNYWNPTAPDPAAYKSTGPKKVKPKVKDESANKQAAKDVEPAVEKKEETLKKVESDKIAETVVKEKVTKQKPDIENKEGGTPKKVESDNIAEFNVNEKVTKPKTL